MRDEASIVAELEALPDEAMVPALVRSGLRPPAHLLERLTEYVAGRGFDPRLLRRVGLGLHGQEWQGRLLGASDRLPIGDLHYLKHVVVQREWPEGTTQAEYVGSIATLVRAAATGILASRYPYRWHLTLIGPSGAMRGIGGGDWCMLEYDVLGRTWLTAFQPARGLDYVVAHERRRSVTWLREPGIASG